MSVDEAFIDIAAGDGGSGCVSFSHENTKNLWAERGGGRRPCMQADINLNTLVDFRFRAA
jgi:GTP-binding protein